MNTMVDYYEKHPNGDPLSTKNFDYEANGYDGFLGFGTNFFDECCKNCICADKCSEYELFIQYFWQAPCTDLDTATSFKSSRVGYGCPNDYDDIFWVTDDDTGVGGVEVSKILFDSNDLPQEEGTFLEVNLHAHWYYEIAQGCTGNYQIYITTNIAPPSENNTLLFKAKNTLVVQESCSTNLVETLQFNSHEVRWK